MRSEFDIHQIGNRSFRVQHKGLDGAFEIRPDVDMDWRGGLIRTNTARLLAEYNLSIPWVEDYYSFTLHKHLVRGLYVYRSPYSVNKLITAVRGELLWISVDLRTGSPTFGEWTSCLLSETLYNSFLSPVGCANGCISITDNAGVFVKSDKDFDVNYGVGLKWNDEELGIDWQVNANEISISETHANFKSFGDFKQKYGSIQC